MEYFTFLLCYIKLKNEKKMKNYKFKAIRISINRNIFTFAHVLLNKKNIFIITVE